MASIDTMQSKVIEEANKRIDNLPEFENACRIKLAQYQKTLASSKVD